MSNLQEELTERFNTLVELKDPEKFFFAFTEYLRFIQDTSTLSGIARQIFADGLCSEVGRFYKTLHEMPFVETKKIWANSHRRMLGLQEEYDTGLFGFSVGDVPGMIKCQARLFHLEMESATKKWLAGNKIRILINKKDTTIYLAEDLTKNYPIKSRGEYKSKGVPRRLQILLIFGKQVGGISAKILTKKLGTKDESGTRKEIVEINRLFRGKVSDKGKLIIWKEKGGKNIYSLNYEIFEFDFK